MKSIIFYGTYNLKSKNVIKIKSDCYYAFKNSVLEETERINGYTSMEDIVSCTKTHTTRTGLDKEYFIEETPKNIPYINKELDWFVFEYEPKSLKTFIKTNATNTIVKLINVKKESESDIESETEDSYNVNDFKYK